MIKHHNLLLLIITGIIFGIFSNTIYAQAPQTGPVFTVNITADSDDGQCTDIHCTLREAINAANVFIISAPTINIPAGTFQVTSDLPPLQRPDMEIMGAGINDTIIQANNNNLFQIPAIHALTSLNLSDLRINNVDTILNVATYVDLDAANIALTGSVGQIYRDQTNTFSELNFDNLQVDGITSTPAALFELVRSGINIENSAITNSQIPQLFNIRSTAVRSYTISNTTISGNTFDTNGPVPNAIVFIDNEAVMSLAHVTIANNINFGFAVNDLAFAGLAFEASILANNTFLGAAIDCELFVAPATDAFVSISNSIIPNNNCATIPGNGTPITLDPLLLPLADNGGDTLTHSFDPASPALDGVACIVNRDQRNTSRPRGAACDIGAFELDTLPPPTAIPATPVSPTAIPQAIILFDPAISKIGFLQTGQLGLTGEQVEWVISVQNVSSVVGNNVMITDTLVPELRIDRVVAPNGTVTINGQTVTVNYASLNPGQTVQFSIFTTVLSGARVNNTACVNASNQGAEECFTGSVISTLPNTGETPFWRNWVLYLAGMSLLLGLSCFRVTFTKQPKQN